MIEIKGLNKYYEKGKSNQVHAVKNANLTLPDHGIVAIFGKSGCGKTTLLNIIGGLDNAQSGQVLIDGEKITPTADQARNHGVGYIFQNYNLIKTMSVYDNVATSLRLCGIRDEELIHTRTMAALAGVEMEKYKNRLPDSLSGGQQQRIAIARALVKNPRLILADEPTGNLDEQNTVMVMDLLHEIAKDHLVLLVTHEAELVDLYCDMVIEMSDGAVTNQRENQTTSGWQGKGKNDIYLGDLDHSVAQGEGLQVDYYGDASQAPQGLRLISVGNTLYLQAPADVRIRVLDSASELKVHEGSYQPTAPRKTAALDPALHQPLPQGKGAGKMFRCKDAIVSGFRQNFSGAKKGRKLLIAGLFSFALVFVLMVSYFGHSFSDYLDAKEKFNSQILYLSAESIADRAELESLIATGKVDSAHIVSGVVWEQSSGKLQIRIQDPITWSFGIGNFESTDADYMRFDGNASVLESSAAQEHRLLCGKKELQGKEILISSAFADALLEVCGVSYMDSYEDLLYIDGYYNWVRDDANTYTIVGIVEDSDPNTYLSDEEIQRVALGTVVNYTNRYGVLSQEDLTRYRLEPLNAGEIYLTGGRVDLSVQGASKVETGDTVYIGGKAYLVKKALSLEINDPQARMLEDKAYTAYWSPKAQEIKENMPFLPDAAAYQTYLEGMTEGIYSDSAWYALQFIQDSFYQYQNEQHQTPNPDPMLTDYYVYMEGLRIEYDNWHNEMWERYNQEWSEMWEHYQTLPTVMMAQSDYMGLATDLALHDSQSENSLFRVEEKEEDDKFSYNSGKLYFALHAEDLEALLAKTEGKGTLTDRVTPEMQLDIYKEEFEEEMVVSMVFLTLFGVLMALCLYFIMRSGMMSAIREIGIYRAIGAGRRNLVFRYFVETLVVFSLTVLLGFVCSSAALWWLLSKTKMLAAVIFYPVWMGGIVLSVLFAINVVCGLLPILTLLRKTPAQILAKYDI